jgi:6-oxo-cyclohex-1-ene-carbonyl-CoA hydrolase
VPNPVVVTDRWVDEMGRVVYGRPKEGEALAEAKAAVARCTVDHTLLDERVERLAWKLALTMPDCTTKTVESLRKHKLRHWHANRESNRAWLALNMATEAKAGFPAFHYGPKGKREVDFLRLRRLLAEGRPFDDDLIREVSPQHAKETVS